MSGIKFEQLKTAALIVAMISAIAPSVYGYFNKDKKVSTQLAVIINNQENFKIQIAELQRDVKHIPLDRKTDIKEHELQGMHKEAKEKIEKLQDRVRRLEIGGGNNGKNSKSE